MNQQVDLIIQAKILVPIRPAGYQNQQAIAIDKGIIVAIGSVHELSEQYQAKEVVDLDDHIVLPGLINTHNHAAMSLLRGYSDDHPLNIWLEQHIWPAEAKHVDDEFVSDGTELAIAEMLKSGTTCFSDMYFYPDACAKVVHHTGIRAQITFPVIEFPTNWAHSVDEYLSKGLSFYDDYRSHTLISPGFGPHAPYTVSDDTFKRIVPLAAELQAPLQMHVHETKIEVDNSIKNCGMRPIERLDKLGVLGPLTQCVHMTSLNSEDLTRVREAGAHIIHCPESNLKLASGFNPVERILNEGINLSLGTDGCASNNNQDMFGEMHTAALLAKAVSNNASTLGAQLALEMATINGAYTLGLEKVIGSIEVGKQADIIAIKIDPIDHQPMYNPVSQLVYTHNGHRVSDSWINGRRLVRNFELTTIDVNALSSKVALWQDKITGENT